MDGNYKETTTESINLTTIASDGSSFPIAGKKEIVKEKYSIKKLNARFWLSKKGQGMMKDIFTIQENICKSSKDIHMFRSILLNTNSEHMFIMSAVRFGDMNDVTRSKSFKFISDAVKNKFLYKLDTNIYLVNPFVFTPVGAIAENIQDAQFQWQDLMMKEDMKDPEKSGLINVANELKEKYELEVSIHILLDNNFFLSVLDQYRNGKSLSDKQIEALKKIY